MVGTVRSKGRWDEVPSVFVRLPLLVLFTLGYRRRDPVTGQARPVCSVGTLLGFQAGLALR